MSGFSDTSLRVTRRQQFRHERGPAGLGRRSESAAGIAVEVLVEEHMIPELRIGLKPLVGC